MPYSREVFVKELGARLKQMRKERGWTLRHMVVEHGFHITQWQRLENAKGISITSLLQVCDLFDVRLEKLVEGLGISEPEPAKSPAKAAKHTAKKAASRSKRSASTS